MHMDASPRNTKGQRGDKDLLLCVLSDEHEGCSIRSL
jgi:hypothetical protein